MFEVSLFLLFLCFFVSWFVVSSKFAVSCSWWGFEISVLIARFSSVASCFVLFGTSYFAFPAS